MQIGRATKALWHDVWVFFRVSGATTWVLPPGHWMTLMDVESATLEFEVTAVGPGATKMSLGVERTAAPSADDIYWSQVVATGGTGTLTMARGQQTHGVILGAGGGLADDGWSFPLGRLRTRISATGLTGTEWAAVRVRAHVTTR